MVGCKLLLPFLHGVNMEFVVLVGGATIIFSFLAFVSLCVVECMQHEDMMREFNRQTKEEGDNEQ